MIDDKSPADLFHRLKRLGMAGTVLHLAAHPDHEAAGRLTREACFYSGIGAAGTQSPFRPERVYYYLIHHHVTPSFVVDITPVWQRKMAVIAAYTSQFSEEDPETGGRTAISDPRFLKVQESRAVYFGAMIGASYGEAYFSATPVPAVEVPGIYMPLSSTGGLPPHGAL